MSHHTPQLEHAFLTRRQMLERTGMGLGALAFGGMFGPEAQAAGGINSTSPFAPKQPHFEPKAKRVIHFFMNGGPSQVDTFDPKPMLTKFDGKTLPNVLKTERPTGAGLKSPFAFKKYGECGLEVCGSHFSHCHMSRLEREVIAAIATSAGECSAKIWVTMPRATPSASSPPPATPRLPAYRSSATTGTPAIILYSSCMSSSMS